MANIPNRPEEIQMSLEHLVTIINLPMASEEMIGRRRKASREIQRRGFKIVGGDKGPYTIEGAG